MEKVSGSYKIVLPYLDLLVRKPPMSSTCTYIRSRCYARTTVVIGKNEYKRKPEVSFCTWYCDGIRSPFYSYLAYRHIHLATYKQELRSLQKSQYVIHLMHSVISDLLVLRINCMVLRMWREGKTAGRKES
jgi:hypothetical protein